MNAFNFLLTERESKPRDKGITMVLDKGLGYDTAKCLMEIAGDYVDYLKFGWGTTVVQNERIVKAKVKMYKKHDIQPYTGGTLFELAYLENKIPEFFEEAKRLGFETIEISNGSTNLPYDEKIYYIKQAKDFGFNVISEVGKKNPALDKELSLEDRVKYMNAELEAGSTKVIVEAREGGKNIGIFDENSNVKEDEVDYILNNISNPDDIIWEAPKKDQQVYFILKLGSDANLGNISTDEIISLETIRRGLRGDTLGKL
ncbi:phosphosulfolactate synthase [Methanobrevibacter sp. 87.7]|uniref:phosphosulfolactate synthase n=1 Tax=Methanobrevibacter sp. 87.7 TaxID=387957 RepID=UPI000B510C1A|nr:phosphosulfolactate synthase [Methanobrevibacter sp. 87.7]OWT33854.1 phosphosulfolactate synthase [Methanobrevibacter sp. 87.7]